MRRVPDTWLFEPWHMPDDVQRRCGLQPGQDLPVPLVDLDSATRRAKERVYALRRDPQVRAAGAITLDVARAALRMLEVDEHGFDEVDRKLLQTIIEKFGGGPVGIGSIAAAISEEKDAIEDIYEPFLIQNGFLDRTPRGRVATPRAYEYLGLDAPGQRRKDPRLW